MHPFTRINEPVTIDCKNILEGIPISGIHLMTYHASSDSWESVPFQVDKKTTRVRDFEGYQIEYLSDEKGLMDFDDELVFLSVAGEKTNKWWNESRFPNRLEVKLKDPLDGSESFLYLYYSAQTQDGFDRAAETFKVMSADNKGIEIETPTYRLLINRDGLPARLISEDIILWDGCDFGFEVDWMYPFVTCAEVNFIKSGVIRALIKVNWKVKMGFHWRSFDKTIYQVYPDQFFCPSLKNVFWPFNTAVGDLHFYLRHPIPFRDEKTILHNGFGNYQVGTNTYSNKLINRYCDWWSVFLKRQQKGYIAILDFDISRGKKETYYKEDRDYWYYGVRATNLEENTYFHNRSVMVVRICSSETIQNNGEQEYQRMLHPLQVSLSYQRFNSKENIELKTDKTIYLFQFDHPEYHLINHSFFRELQEGRIELLKRFPYFRTGLQVDTFIFESLIKNHPTFIEDLKRWLHTDFKGRYGLVGGVYSDSLGNLISGEANIRNFYYGKMAAQEILDYDIRVFATQEPTLFAQMPQIMVGFGYKMAICRTHLGTYGISPEYDGDIGNWRSPDGSSIAAIPEYKGAGPRWSLINHKHQNHSEILAGPGNFGRLGFNGHKSYWQQFYRPDVCNKVVLTTFLDSYFNYYPGPCYELEWNDQGINLSPNISYRYLGPDELSNEFGDPHLIFQPQASDFVSRMIWGACGNLVYNLCRQAEISVLLAERIAALNSLFVSSWQRYDKEPRRPFGGVELETLCSRNYEEELDLAWKKLLLAQHHDFWWEPNRFLNAENRMKLLCDDGVETNVSNLTAMSINASKTVIEKCIRELAAKVNKPEGDKIILLFNPLAIQRSELLRVKLEFDHAQVHGFCIFDGEEEIPYQEITRKIYSDKSLKEIEVAFYCTVPSLGYKTLTVHYRAPSKKATGMRVDEKTLSVSTQRYDIRFADHGSISLFYDKRIGRDVLKRKGRNACFRGFIKDKEAFSRGTVEFITKGPYLSIVRERGEIGGVPYENLITIYDQLERIDFKTKFMFNGEEIGKQQDPFLVNDRIKLGVLIEAPDEDFTVYTDRPFAVIEGKQPSKETCMTSVFWCDVSWVDSHGFALFNRGTQGYLKESNLLFMPLAFSQNFTFENDLYSGWKSVKQLKAPLTYEYSLYPHSGNWKTGDVLPQAEMYNFPVLVRVDEAHPGTSPTSFSLLSLDAPNVVVSAVYTRDGEMYLRMWEYHGKEAEVNISREFHLQEVNFLHESQDEVGLPLKFRPYQIRTFKLIFDEIKTH